MRYRRTRKQFKLILISLLTICLMLFVESRIEAFVPQLKNFAEIEVEKRFSDKFSITIGNIDGGILHPLVFNNIEIRNKKDKGLFPSLVISSIRTTYRIWDIFFKETAASKILSSDSCIYINFETAKREISGFVRFEGDLSNSKVKGYALFPGGKKVDFTGMVKENSFDLEFRPETGTLRAEGNFSENGDLTANLKANHLKFYGFDIVCDAVLHNTITGPYSSVSDNNIKGEFETKNLVINYKPFLDLKTSYAISGGILEIPSLDFGDVIKIAAKVVLKKPQIVDVMILANNLNLSWLLYNLGIGDAASILSGTMNGKFEFKGPASKLKTSAYMEIRKGTIGELDFEYLTANLKGDLPFIRIEDSRITRESGYFSLAGEIDLRKTKGNLFGDIKLVTDDKAITWDEFRTTKIQDVQQISMKKKISEDINLDFKKYISEEKIDESIPDTDEIEVEYKLHPNESLRMMMGKDKNLLALEHKDKF